jgi:hypothetical protein
MPSHIHFIGRSESITVEEDLTYVEERLVSHEGGRLHLRGGRETEVLVLTKSEAYVEEIHMGEA